MKKSVKRSTPYDEFRVVKVIMPDWAVEYWCGFRLDSGEIEYNGCSSIAGVAGRVDELMEMFSGEKHQAKEKLVRARILFNDPHGDHIVVPKRQPPELMLGLTASEITEFWRYFLKITRSQKVGGESE